VATVSTYLDEILAAHRQAAEEDTRPLGELVEQALALPPCRGFAAALAGEGLSVIAEIKRRSPSKGDLAPGLVPSVLGKAYAAGGAACLSVLTDEAYFGGSVSDLIEARAAVDVPVLRKDFTVSANDVCDARLMGADAVLLIVAALSDTELTTYLALAADIGLDALVEVHDLAEAEQARAAGAALIGVNARDLRTFEVDLDGAAALIAALPDNVVRVAESGIRSPADAAKVAATGCDAVLVGEHLVTAPDPGEALRELVSACS
jgi:indole-3-glycerol phosphate synthase